MRLTGDVMWERMMASDASYNGRFFTGVHSTGIYCLPSCRARKPNRANVRFYKTADEAVAAGLRPCKKCRPDEFVQGIDPDLERLSKLMDRIRSDPARFRSVDDIAYDAAMSASSLFTAFRTHYHASPGALLNGSRVRKAAELLRGGRLTAAETGFAVGFESTSAFYENFRRAFGMPPAQYQRLGAATSYTIELPEAYRPEFLLSLLARDPESPTERVDGQRFVVSLWAGDAPAVVQARFDGSRLHVCLPETGDPYAAHAQLTRLLGLDQDPGHFEEHVRGLGLDVLIEGREGLRIPQSPTPFDGLVWSIVGQQVGIGFAATLRRRVSVVAGVPLNGVMSAPPTAERVAQLSVDELLPLQFSRRKAEYLIGAAQAVAEGRLDFNLLMNGPPTRAEQSLLALRGIGPWSANYLMMRSLGFADCVPVGDTGLTSALARFFGVARPDPEQTLALMARFRPFRSLATFHLWRSLTKASDA